LQYCYNVHIEERRENMQRIVVDVTDKFKHELKILVAEQNTTIKDFVLTAIEKYKEEMKENKEE